MSHVDRIARLKIEVGDWRLFIWRVEVPRTASLKALRAVTRAVMSFDDCHLFEFRADGEALRHSRSGMGQSARQDLLR